MNLAWRPGSESGISRLSSLSNAPSAPGDSTSTELPSSASPLDSSVGSSFLWLGLSSLTRSEDLRLVRRAREPSYMKYPPSSDPRRFKPDILADTTVRGLSPASTFAASLIRRAFGVLSRSAVRSLTAGRATESLELSRLRLEPLLPKAVTVLDAGGVSLLSVVVVLALMEPNPDWWGSRSIISLSLDSLSLNRR